MIGERRGNVIILALLWTALLLAGLYAVVAVGEGLTLRLRLTGAMATAAVSLVHSFRFTGPSRFSALVYQGLVARDLGGRLPFTLTTFIVRPLRAGSWQVSASGYVLWPVVTFRGTVHAIEIFSRIGP